jgi:DNA-binding transcriptional ArsR family regulator
VKIQFLDDMIESVSVSAPALVPLFRSKQQLNIVAVLFDDHDVELTIGELATRAGVAQATASREVARLRQHGLLRTRELGRNTLVSANWSLPWANELRSILVQTVGVLGRLAHTLSPLAGIDEAFVFGSWAARYTGEAGPPPRDVDVLVVGDVPLREVRRALDALETDLRVEVSPVVIDKRRWAADDPDPFVAELRSRPLVRIPLDER